MRREYWTYLDNSNNHYEISNLGRVRNASTQRIMHPTWNAKRQDYHFNINYKDVPRRKIWLKRAVYSHFGELSKREYVGIIDPSKPLDINNLEIYREKHRERKSTKITNKLCERPNEIWEQTYKTCKVIIDKQYTNSCKHYGIDTGDLLHEATIQIIRDYDTYNQSDNFFTFCRLKIKECFWGLKPKDYLSMNDYVIGKRFDD